MNLLSYLSLLQQQVAQKREQLSRLQSTVRELDDTQSEFIHSQKRVDDPELSPAVWKGNLANEFSDVRENMMTSYRDMAQNQLSETIQLMESKCQSLQYEINSLEADITREKADLERKRNEKK
ncbi:YwqH-like family protein [Rossellomorea sp. H39__3]|uniref:YwqH-like family protein n=1 Tax=Rossellomorea marisflavi TaxID=189381 RepID=UPI0006F4C060|nr:hypothetical protein ASG66_03325 [Bacillus sp. Leaf406]